MLHSLFKKGLILLFCLLAGACATMTAQKEASDQPSKDPTLRHIVQGELTGLVSENGALAWRGIPYAEAPIGPLRWKTPRAPAPWSGTFSATRNGNACFQDKLLAQPFTDDDGDGFVGSEDCLYLNIFAPEGSSAAAKLPVMYWIHGGGNVGGHNATPGYDGAVLAQKHQVVVVAINYRLGLMGWFMHSALAGPDTVPTDRSGNWGTLDTIRGLEWVRDNISAFGGDPGNVTVFGESAGGVNVYSLLLSPLARGLFSRAIVQSGGLLEMPLTHAVNYVDDPVAGMPQSAPEVVNLILIRDGLAKDRNEAKARQLTLSKAEIARLLYLQTPAELTRLVNPTGLRLYPAPRLFSDGVVLPATSAINAFEVGHFSKVPIITGTNRDERRMYMMADPKWRKVLLTQPEDYIRFAKYGSLAWKQRAVDDVARAMTRAGHRDVYAYRFDWDEQDSYRGMNLSVALGAGHTVEIPFVFGTGNGFLVPLGDPDNAERKALSSSMMSYWAEFAYSGSPKTGRNGKEVAWTRWVNDPSANKMIIFDSASGGGVRMSSEEVTASSLKKDLLSDRDFHDQRLHCAIYKALYKDSDAWNDDEYRNLGREGCVR